MKMKNKGFTLIELLAVIIILGILMIIAIPSVTEYINNSRKSAYVATAKQIVSGARNLINSGKYEAYDTDTTYYISSSCINMENANKSPYGDFDPAYVLVTYNGKNYHYYWTSRDTSSMGVKNPVLANDLDTKHIKSDIENNDIKTTVTVEGKTKILKLDGDCKNFSDEDVEKIEYTNLSKHIQELIEDSEDTNTSENHIITFNSSSSSCTNTVAYDNEGNIRYVGSNPCNYVKFNNELWRIIGVTNEENARVKLQRKDSIGSYSWDSNGNGNKPSNGSNNWGIADLMKILNPGYDDNEDTNLPANMEDKHVSNSLYWNRQSGKCAYDSFKANGNHLKDCDFTSTGLLEESKKYIGNATWHLGSIDYNTSRSQGTPSKWYDVERNTNYVSFVKQVGLIYQSDYGFAVGGSDSTREECLSTSLINWNNTCLSNDWLYHNDSDSVLERELILARNKNNSDYLYYITPNGNIADMQAAIGYRKTGSPGVGDINDIRPVVYLNSGVKYKGVGDGSIDLPIELILE